MLEALRNDDIVRKVGGRFKLTALIQHRWLELMQGERPMVDAEGKTEMEVIIEEIQQGKLSFEVGDGSEEPSEHEG